MFLFWGVVKEIEAKLRFANACNNLRNLSKTSIFSEGLENSRIFRNLFKTPLLPSAYGYKKRRHEEKDAV